MLRWALERACGVVPREHVLIVVAEQHRRFWEHELSDFPLDNTSRWPRAGGATSGHRTAFGGSGFAGQAESLLGPTSRSRRMPRYPDDASLSSRGEFVLNGAGLRKRNERPHPRARGRPAGGAEGPRAPGLGRQARALR